MTNEITFQSNCDICGRRDTPCRRHHLIPQRLLKILPKRQVDKWNRQIVNACNSCNKFLHPENKLYHKIKVLEEQLGYRVPDDDAITVENQNI